MMRNMFKEKNFTIRIKLFKRELHKSKISIFYIYMHDTANIGLIISEGLKL